MRTRVWVLLLVCAGTTGCPADKGSDSGNGNGDEGGGQETGETCTPTDEVCDGLDNDCDGVADNGLETSTWYPDEDEDGYGDDDAAIEACSAPTDNIASGGDCDDSDATIRPGVPELCDEEDNDCDGRTDDADPDVDGQSTVYLDADGDGLGVEPAFLFCEVPEGYSYELGDCDDSNSRVTTYTWYQDADGDGYGMDGEVEACTVPDGYVVNNRDCDDGEALSNPGLDEICADGIDNDCDGGSNDCVPWDGKYPSSTSASAVVDSAYSYMGLFNSVGDTDGDGKTEVVVASPYAGGYGTGAIYMHEGMVKGSAHVDGDAMAYVYDDSGSYIGWSGTTVGDLDGDGYDDLGAWQASGDTFWSGDGPFASSSSFSTAAYATLSVSGSDTNYYSSIAGADLDGDGQSDLVLGMSQVSSSYTYEGVGCLVDGTAIRSGSKVTDLASACVYGGSTYAYAGRSVASLGDLDGDGLPEAGIAAYAASSSRYSYTGALAVLNASDSGSFNLSDAGLSVYGSYSYDYLGSDVASEGDSDGDGYADILVSATDDPFYGYGDGAALLFNGSATLSGTLSATAADTVIYSTAGYQFAQNIGWAGDLDGDGADDIIAGDYNDNTYGSGAAYLFYGPPSAHFLKQSDADAIFYSTTAYGYLGFGVGSAGDLDADGYDEMIIGEYQTSSTYLFFGGSL